jgi:hypothetical protein
MVRSPKAPAACRTACTSLRSSFSSVAGAMMAKQSCSGGALRRRGPPLPRRTSSTPSFSFKAGEIWSRGPVQRSASGSRGLRYSSVRRVFDFGSSRSQASGSLMPVSQKKSSSWRNSAPGPVPILPWDEMTVAQPSKARSTRSRRSW